MSSIPRRNEPGLAIPSDNPSAPLLPLKVETLRPCTKYWFKGTLPLIIVIFLFSFTFYTYVFLVSIPLMRAAENSIRLVGRASLIIYLTFLGLTLLSFLFCVFLDPGSVPSSTDLEASASKLPFCQICNQPKPQRSHHCSRCRRCIQKMDHHCPWINNCVGWRNLKAFLLFCSYTAILAMLVDGFVITRLIISYWFDDPTHLQVKIHTWILLGLTLLLASLIVLLLTSFVANHYYLVFRNMTSLEYWRNKREYDETQGRSTQDFKSRWCPMLAEHMPHRFDLGPFANFKQVFGKNPLFWLLPFPTVLGNGIDWPLRNEEYFSSRPSSDT